MKTLTKIRKAINRLDPILPPIWALIVISAVLRDSYPKLSLFLSGVQWGLILAQFVKMIGVVRGDFRLFRNMKRERIFWDQVEKASREELKKFVEGYTKAGFN